jgi:hypothetical protein
MVRLTKTSKPAGSDSGVSGGSQQATTDNTGLSSPTVPTKSKCRPGHVISSEATTSTQTAQEVKSRKRPAQALKEGSSPSKRQRKLRKQLENVRPVNSSNSLYASPQRVGILNLPLELMQQVLSDVPARETVRFRRVCKSMDQLVVRSTKYLVKLYAGRELSRLREVVNEFNGLKKPTDTDSLVEALHIWTKRRGQFAHQSAAASSAFKFIAHFMVQKKNHFNHTVRRPSLLERRPTVEWAYTAMRATQMLSYPPTKSQLELLFSELTRIGMLDYHELNKLFEYAKDPGSQPANHRLVGQIWPEEKLEHMTLPGPWKLAPLLQHPSSYSLEEPRADNDTVRHDTLSDVDSLERFFTYILMPREVNLLPPDLGNKLITHHLGLPALPNAVSCY